MVLEVLDIQLTECICPLKWSKTSGIRGAHSLALMQRLGPKMCAAHDTTPFLHGPYMVPHKTTPWYKDRMFYLNLIRRSLAEFLGTGLFVFTAVSSLSSVVTEEREGVTDRSSMAVSAGLAQGTAYGALVAAMMHVR